MLVNVAVGAVFDGLVKDFTKKLKVEPAGMGLLENFKLAVTVFALTVQVAVVTEVPDPQATEVARLKSAGNVIFN